MDKTCNRSLLDWRSFVLVCIAFFLPGRVGVPFSGIPVNTGQGYVIFIILLLSLIYYILRYYQVIQDCNVNIRIPSRLITIFNSLWPLVLLVSLKVLLFFSNYLAPPPMAQYCYHTQGEELSCYKSVENPFFIQKVTMLNEKVLWEGHGSLEHWYLNDGEYFAIRDRKVTITAEFLTEADKDKANKELLFQYRGQIDLVLDGHSYQFSSDSLKEAKVPLKLELAPQRTHVLKVSFVASEGNYFKVLSDITLHSSNKAGDLFFKNIPGNAFGIILSLYVALLVLQLTRVISFRIYFFGLLILIPIVLFASIKINFSLLLLLVYVGALFFSRRYRSLNYMDWILILFLCTLANFVYHFDTFDKIHFTALYDDPYLYNTFARDVIKNVTLRAGEDVFYYQPGYRYVMVVALMLFGEKNIFFMFLRFFFIVSTFWIFSVWLEKRVSLSFLSRLTITIMLLLIGRYGLDLARVNLGEYLTWGMALIAIMVVFSKSIFSKNFKVVFVQDPSPYVLSWFAFFIALSAFVRPNQWPGMILLYGIVTILLFNCYKKQWKGYFFYLSLLTVGLFFFFPLLHNIYWGDTFIFLSKSLTLDKYAQRLTVFDVLRVFSDERVQEQLLFQIQHLFALKTAPDLPPLNQFALLLFNLIFTSFVLSSLRQIYLKNYKLVCCCWIVVGSFAGVHLLYNIENYYPRHIFMTYILATYFAAIMWRKESAKENKIIATKP
ncbi:MAG: hypothetical protein HQK52_05715 [Oligoflexia bacterium]|nr:hypothetical protein [Oligoflexia bacterium]